MQIQYDGMGMSFYFLYFFVTLSKVLRNALRVWTLISDLSLPVTFQHEIYILQDDNAHFIGHGLSKNSSQEIA